jgi:GT2 family glycosyltransferase
MAPRPGPDLDLTTIVVVGSLRDRARRCLDVLVDQATPATEVLVVDIAPADTAPFPERQVPGVRVLRLPADTTFSRARAAGVRAARGRVVAFLEEHALPLDGWTAAVLAAHQEPYAGIGGQMDNANPGVGLSDITGLMSYGLFYAPLHPREAAMIVGHNSSYKRDALLALGADLDRLLACDLVLMMRLRALGHRLFLDPRIRVAHANEVALRSVCRGYFLHHRTYGPLRAREARWPWWRRLIYIAATPLIPVYFFVRFRRILRRHRPDLVGTLDRGAVRVYIAQLAGACGQAVGLAAGPGRAEADFTEYELTEPRPLEMPA